MAGFVRETSQLRLFRFVFCAHSDEIKRDEQGWRAASQEEIFRNGKMLNERTVQLSLYLVPGFSVFDECV